MAHDIGLAESTLRPPGAPDIPAPALAIVRTASPDSLSDLFRSLSGLCLPAHAMMRAKEVSHERDRTSSVQNVASGP